jgi:hypothetical protein
MVEIPMITIKEDSTQRLEGTQPNNSPIIREEVDNALCARLVGKCILGDAGSDSQVVIGVVDQDTLRRIAGPQPTTNQNRLGEQRNTALARVYALTLGDAIASNEVVTGTLLISSKQATVLFDSGATHSFVSYSFSRDCNLMSK